MNILRLVLLGLIVVVQVFIMQTTVLASNEDYIILREVASDNNKFAIDLFNNLNTKDDNVFFSPYSISTVLAMTYAGARGNTEKQMAEVLNYNLDQNKLHKAFSILEKKLELANSDGNQLTIANAIWMENTCVFLSQFLNEIKVNYGPVFFKVDFKNNYKKVRSAINQWVESKTNNKIQNLVPEGALDSLTKMVLANAIYFNGKWARQFKASMTKEDKFWLNSNKYNMVPLMSLQDDLNYWKSDGLQMVELPYTGNKLSMIIILPDKANDVSNIESGLFASWDRNNYRSKVHLFLPKFKMDYSINLNGILSQMGMPDAFGDMSDFSGMNGKKDLYISAILHKAFVDVSEKGTEAAAATAVVMSARSMSPQEMRPVIMKIDHPFIFVIRHNESGSIVFMGKVYDPLKG